MAENTAQVETETNTEGTAPETPVVETTTPDNAAPDASASAGEAPADDAGDDFAELADFPEDGAEDAGTPSPADEPAPEPEATPAEEPTPDGVSAEGKPTTPATEQKPEGEEAKSATVEAPKPEEAPAETAPAETPQPTMTPEEAQAARDKWVNEASDELAKNLFAMTEEEVQQFEENPGEVLPKVAARATIHAIEASTQTILQQLPRLVEGALQVQKNQAEDEQAFFGAWPKLAEHRDTVFRLGMAYRQANPQATKEQFVQEVGAHAMLALKLPFADEPPAAPQPPTPRAHVPAGTTAAPTAPAAPESLNEFEVLSEVDAD